MSQTFTTDSATATASWNGAGTSPRRLMFTTTELQSDGYDSWRREVRRETLNVAEATLVTSCTAVGTHAPALDLDFPSVVTVDAEGRATLWVEAPLRRRAFARFLAVAAELGLVVNNAAQTRRSLRQDERRC